ncbi:DNA modification methylase [Candidatus Avelusimicrobium faecicola]|uniref:DNA modification methylase n=1 Tax=Candidatus Avelusimicrobium faecicola TaxID=3416205 RepID=UPI003C9B5544|nr:BREX-1 system adenine-specific DNA-methyltransferase PglX [Spirochaetota bacterium]
MKTHSGKKGVGMPVVRNPQFYFKEGFCWNDVNTIYLKCRVKGKSINDVKSMSMYTLTNIVPKNCIISLINSTFISEYVNNFVNNTQTFQINDARQIPIIIPSKNQLEGFKVIFENAYRIKKDQFANNIAEEKANKLLVSLQKNLDGLVKELYSV